MLDVDSIHITAKCSWIRRLFDDNNSKWKTLSWELLNLEPYQLKLNFTLKTAERCKTNFHKQLIQSWYKISCSEPHLAKHILNQYLLENHKITINNKVYNKETKLIDIIDTQGEILSRPAIRDKLDWDISQLKYNSLITSVPKKWKDILRNINNIDLKEKT